MCARLFGDLINEHGVASGEVSKRSWRSPEDAGARVQADVGVKRLPSWVLVAAAIILAAALAVVLGGVREHEQHDDDHDHRDVDNRQRPRRR